MTATGLQPRPWRGHSPMMAYGFSLSKTCGRDSSPLQTEVFPLLGVWWRRAKSCEVDAHSSQAPTDVNRTVFSTSLSTILLGGDKKRTWRRRKRRVNEDVKRGNWSSKEPDLGFADGDWKALQIWAFFLTFQVYFFLLIHLGYDHACSKLKCHKYIVCMD